jgi:hypothetical protein
VDQLGDELWRTPEPPRDLSLWQRFVQIQSRQGVWAEPILHALAGADVAESGLSSQRMVALDR